MYEDKPPTVPLISLSHDKILENGGQTRKLLEEFDWEKTSLGHRSTWPSSFETIISTILMTKFPITLWLGPEAVQIYNDAYIFCLAEKHPSAFGMPAREVWAEAWELLEPIIRVINLELRNISNVHQGAATEGKGLGFKNLYVPINREVPLQESHFDFCYSPVMDGTVSC